VKNGDLADKEYWWAKAYFTGFEAALKTKQPEGAIKDYIKEKALPAIDEALKKYANHEDIKKWKEKIEGIQKKIDPNASWASWKNDFPWGAGQTGPDLFMNGWVELNRARFAKGAGDWRTAGSEAMSAHNHLGEYGAAKHMRPWPADIQTFVTDGDKEATALMEESRKHT
jgi:hypothetical protein